MSAMLSISAQPHPSSVYTVPLRRAFPRLSQKQRSTYSYRPSASSITLIDTRTRLCTFRNTSSSVCSCRNAITLRRSSSHISGNARGASDAEAGFATQLTCELPWWECGSCVISIFRSWEGKYIIAISHESPRKYQVTKERDEGAAPIMYGTMLKVCVSALADTRHP